MTTLPISVSRTSLVGLYDTGADVCCIKELAFKWIPEHQKPKLLNCKPSLFKQLAEATSARVGSEQVTIQVGNRKLTNQFVFVKGLIGDMILGINFIHQFHLNYNTFWKKSNKWQKGRTHTLKECSICFILCKGKNQKSPRMKRWMPKTTHLPHLPLPPPLRTNQTQALPRHEIIYALSKDCYV